MKNAIVIIILTLNAFIGLAQADSTVLHNAWGGSFGVGVGHRFLNSSDDRFSFEKELYDSLEVPSVAWFGELTYYKRFNPHWRIQGSIGWMKMGYNVDSIPEAGIKQQKLQYGYAALPLKLQYVSSEKNAITFSATAGVIPMFLMSQHTRVYYIGDSKTEKLNTSSDKNSFGLAAHLSSGIEFRVLEKYRIGTELFFRQSLTTATDGDLQRRLNAGGLSISIIKTL